MSFAIQYASDFHLEMYERVDITQLIVPTAPFLALVGDIGSPYKDLYRQFLEHLSTQFDRVFLLAGNHEFYNKKGYGETIQHLRSLVQGLPKVTFLHNEVYELDTVRIFGSTLWSRISVPASRLINDYKRIKRMTREDTLRFHEEAVACIEQEMERESIKPLLMLTHFAPHSLMNGKYQGNDLESAFSTDLSSMMKPPVVGWICGHTHQNVEATVHKVPVVSNCFGYDAEEQSTYRRDKVLTVEFD